MPERPIQIARMNQRKTRIARSEKEPPKARPSEIPYVTLVPPNAWSDFDELAIWLSANDQLYAGALKELPAELGEVERMLASQALSGVIQFLTLRSPSEILNVLLKALIEVQSGGHPEIFQPASASQNRPPAPAIVQTMKGALAGLTRAKQDDGLTRDAAAAWIARNTAPELARKLSNRAITGRTVREWLDRFGGEHPPDDFGGKAFRIWSHGLKELTTARVHQLTFQWAQAVPSRSKSKTR